MRANSAYVLVVILGLIGFNYFQLFNLNQELAVLRKQLSLSNNVDAAKPPPEDVNRRFSSAKPDHLHNNGAVSLTSTIKPNRNSNENLDRTLQHSNFPVDSGTTISMEVDPWQQKEILLENFILSDLGNNAEIVDSHCDGEVCKLVIQNQSQNPEFQLTGEIIRWMSNLNGACGFRIQAADNQASSNRLFEVTVLC